MKISNSVYWHRNWWENYWNESLPDTSNKSEKLVVRCHDTSVPHGRSYVRVPSIGNKTPKGTWPKAWGSCGHYDLGHLRLIKKNKINTTQKVWGNKLTTDGTKQDHFRCIRIVQVIDGFNRIHGFLLGRIRPFLSHVQVPLNNSCQGSNIGGLTHVPILEQPFFGHMRFFKVHA